ncbi:MAG: UDP-N-acetylmuramate--L-alanine ligase [Syntrophomonadaceae bacterium]|jgi:UDP-N-acetylmuramate--alanine ligase|nr:UDP-N-acetylmuramate--L-alanine ligase [Syntrophomonadaceae bacterium]
MAAAKAVWVHMVGIAGAGMSGIARVLNEEGYRVSGSDLQNNSTTKKLSELGIEVFQGHSSSHVQQGIQRLVASTAIPANNPELMAAREKGIPVWSRGQMLAELVNKRQGIAVAGAHGKTTTTSMIYLCLNYNGFDPTFIVGGELQGSGLNACLGQGDYAVVEADESDASFLELNPYVAVITNIEDDHLDYYQSVENIQHAFRQFIDQVKPEGFAMLYGEDEYNQIIKSTASTQVITYGIDKSNDYYLDSWQPQGMGSKCQVFKKSKKIGTMELAVPGRHNSINALAAIAITLELGGNWKETQRAINDFKGAGRRFELIGYREGAVIIDDYAHHPTEIRVTIDAARKVHTGRIVVVFQPHRYTRTKLLGHKLGESLKEADLAIITEIYSAGESPLEGITGQNVYQATKNTGCQTLYLPTFTDIKKYLLQHIQEGDMIITMGAGDVWKIGRELVEEI